MTKPFILALTFNVAGIPLIQPHWTARREAVIRELRASSYDLVALQEVWLGRDARYLFEGSGMPYMARSGEGLAGDGLMIMSRFPILETRHHVFRCVPPSLAKAYEGDAISDKGVFMARVRTPRGELDVYNTHLVSDYPTSRYLSVREAESFEIFEMVRAVSAGRPFVILGDLNAGPADEEYGLLTALLDLDDVCVQKGQDRCGASNAETGRRLDHILLPRGRAQGKARLAFTGTIGGAIPYSDHSAVAAELGPGTLAAPLAPDRGRQAAALKKLRRRLEGMTAAMRRRIAKREWIPIYGFLHGLSYGRQIRNMEAVKNRLDTLLIEWHEQPRDP